MIRETNREYLKENDEKTIVTNSITKGLEKARIHILPVTKLSEDKLTSKYGSEIVGSKCREKFNPNSVTTPPKYITKTR